MLPKKKMDEKILKDAQYRKGLSIAFFNATNAAIALVTAPRVNFESETKEQTKAKIVEYRDWLLEEHKNYYATVIANVGVNYRSADTIENLKATKTMDELKIVWLSLSEDERRDGDIIKVAKELKAAYEKA